MKRLLAVAIAWCGALSCAGGLKPAAPPFDWRLPAGFPLPIAGTNVQTEAKFELGRRLFYDRRLSANGTQACSDCHQQKRAFSDGRARAVGSTGQRHSLNAMTLTNVAYNVAYTWQDVRVRSLEQQALVPMFNEHPVELGVKHHEREILASLHADSKYPAMFGTAFPGERRPMNVTNIARALAAFERALISGGSPYDRLVYGGDEHALSDAAWRGMQVFFSQRAGCSGCHGGFNFSGQARYAGGRPAKPRLAANGVTSGRFRIPTLRNVALTGPYMHDGSMATLAEVIERYSTARDLRLTESEKAELVAFLESLTDERFASDPRFGNPGG